MPKSKVLQKNTSSDPKASKFKQLRTIVLASKSPLSKPEILQRLSEHGYKITTEIGENISIKDILRHKPDIVILDLDSEPITTLQLADKIGESIYRLIAIKADKLKEFPSNWRKYADDIIVKPIRSADVISRLAVAERLLHLEHELKQRMARLEKANMELAQVGAKIKQDLYAVAKIQTSLLPSSLPSIPEASFAWIYKPRMELAGDGLNVFRLDEQHIAFYILDVSGIGTQAALLSVSLSRLISPIPMQSTLLKRLIDTPPGYLLNPPGIVLKSLNEQFPLNIEPIQYFTIFYGMLNVKTLKMRYASAGHPLPIVHRCGIGPITLPGGGYPIGFVEDASFEEYEFSLQHGDRIFVFSDGLSEAHNKNGLQFKLKLHDAISSIARYNVNTSVNELIAQAEKWSGGFSDDVSLLAIDIK